MALTIFDIVDEVSEAMADKLRVRGKSLAIQIRKAGRMLPRRIQRDATYLAQAADVAENPKLARMVDMRKAQIARKDVLAFLETVDLAAERRNMTLQIIASIAFALLFTGIVLLFVLVQRGFV